MDVRTRLLEGAYRCIGEKGLAATSLEDAARAARVSRATLYRYFPGGRDELVGAVISWETLRFFERLAEAVEDAGDLESLLVEGLSFAHEAIVTHAVLQKILETEPALLLPQLTFESSRLIALVGAFFEARFAAYELSGTLEERDAAEYVARLTLSFIGSPGTWDLSDREQVRQLVQSEFLAGLLGGLLDSKTHRGLLSQDVGTALADRAEPGTPLARAASRWTSVSRGVVDGSPASSQESASRARVADAALACVTRFGVAKTTVEDVAREAGLSRATIYRLFPNGRDEIFSATLALEADRYFAELSDRLAGVRDFEDLLVVVLTAAADQIARHEALATLLAHEPEVVLRFVSFAGLDALLDVTCGFLDPYLAPALGATEARRVGEWLTRLVISHVACPPSAVDWQAPAALLGGEPAFARALGTAGARFALHPEPIGTARARQLVRHFVLPGIHALAGSGFGDHQFANFSSDHMTEESTQP